MPTGRARAGAGGSGWGKGARISLHASPVLSLGCASYLSTGHAAGGDGRVGKFGVLHGPVCRGLLVWLCGLLFWLCFIFSFDVELDLLASVTCFLVGGVRRTIARRRR